MSISATTVVDAIEQSTGESDESTLVGQNLYYLASRIGNNERLKYDFNWMLGKQNKLGQSYPNLYLGNYPADNVVYGGNLVNGIPFFAQFGKATNGATHVINHFTTTEAVKPRYHCASKIGSLNPHVIHSTLFHDLNVDQAVGDPVTFRLTGKGLKQHSPAWALNTPTFPNSKSDPFDMFNYLKWGADGSENSLSNVKYLSLQSSQEVKTIIGDNGYYIHVGEWSPIHTILTVGFEDINSALFTDLFAGTTRSLLWKTGKSADQNASYYELDCANTLFYGFIPAKNLGEVVGLVGVFGLENATITVADGLDNSFYTIPS